MNIKLSHPDTGKVIIQWNTDVAPFKLELIGMAVVKNDRDQTIISISDFNLEIEFDKWEQMAIDNLDEFITYMREMHNMGTEYAEDKDYQEFYKWNKALVDKAIDNA